MRWLAIVTVSVAAWIVATTVAGAIAQHHPLPYLDDWSGIGVARLHEAGELTFGHLFAQHNEHRMLFPRLVFLADHALLSDAGVLPQISITIIQALHVVALLALLRWKTDLSTAVGWIGLAVLAICMFSSSQMINFVWSIQVSYVLVLLATTLAFLAVLKLESCADRRAGATVRWPWLGAAIAAGCVATFSLGNGLLVWPLLVALAWLRRLPRGTVATLGASGAGAIAAFFWDYRTPALSANPIDSLGDLASVVVYAACFLGAPFRGLGTGAAGTLGGLVVLVSVSWLVRLFRSRGTAPDCELALGLMLVFALVTAFATALGRIHLPLWTALGARYVTPAMFCWAILIVIALRAASGPTAGGTPVRKLVVGSLLGGFVTLLALDQDAGIRRLEATYRDRELAKMSLLSGVYDEDVLGRVLGYHDRIHLSVEFLRNARLSVFRPPLVDLVGSSLPDRFAVASRPGAGEFEGWRGVPGVAGGVQVFGWAGDGESDAAPDLVVLTDPELRIVGLAHGGVPRPGGGGGWRGYARLAGRPATRLAAYAVRRDGVSAYRLQGEHEPVLQFDPTEDSLGAPIDRLQREGPLDVIGSLAAITGQLGVFLGAPVPTDFRLVPESARSGRVERIEAVVARPGAVRVSGWAWDIEARRPPAVVVLVDRTSTIIGMARTGVTRPDLDDARPDLAGAGVGWEGFAVTAGRQDPSISAHALGQDWRTLYRLPGGQALDDVGTASFQELGEPITDLAAEKSPGWVEDGRVSELLPPPIDTRVFDSWAGRDANIGRLRLGPIAQRDHSVLGLPVLAGPSPDELAVRIVDHDSGTTVARLAGVHAFRGVWRVWRIPLPTPGSNRRITVVVEDQGRGWGAWLAVAAPQWIE